MSNTHEALKLAEEIDSKEWFSCAQAADTIRNQHALIVQMAEALEKCRFDSLNMKLADLGEISDAHAAATQYLKGQQ